MIGWLSWKMKTIRIISYFNTHPNPIHFHQKHNSRLNLNGRNTKAVVFYGLNTLNQIISKSIKLNDFLKKLQLYRGSTFNFCTGNGGKCGVFVFFMENRSKVTQLHCKLSRNITIRTNLVDVFLSWVIVVYGERLLDMVKQDLESSDFPMLVLFGGRPI